MKCTLSSAGETQLGRGRDAAHVSRREQSSKQCWEIRQKQTGSCKQGQVQEGAVAQVQDGEVPQYQPNRPGFGLWGAALD